MVTVTEDRVTGAPIPPTEVRGESGKRLMQHYLDITDRRLCVVEMDIYWAHVAQHQWRWRYDWEGNRVEDIFDPTAQVARQTKRYALFHAKDGDRTAEPAGVGNGYTFIPFGDPRSDIDFERFYRRIGARGLPQLQLRAGQRPRRHGRPRPVPAVRQDQRYQHGPPARLSHRVPRSATAQGRVSGPGRWRNSGLDEHELVNVEQVAGAGEGQVDVRRAGWYPGQGCRDGGVGVPTAGHRHGHRSEDGAGLRPGAHLQRAAVAGRGDSSPATTRPRRR